MCETKKCTKCGEEKPKTLEYFYKSGKFGLEHNCKICKIAYQKENLKNNPEEIAKKRASQAIWNEKNKERNYVLKKAWNLKNKELIKLIRVSKVNRYKTDSEYRNGIRELAKKRALAHISDAYIIEILRYNPQLKYIEIPKELIEVNRKLIQFKRDVRNQKSISSASID